MNHKRLSHLLIASGAVAAAGLGVLFLVYVPLAGRKLRDIGAIWRGLFWPALAYIWVIGGLYMAAMWQYFRISLRIGLDRSFCAENAAGLRRISCLLLLAALLWCVPMLAALCVAAGAYALMFLLAAMASAALGGLAYVLGVMVRQAAQLQEDSELTI